MSQELPVLGISISTGWAVRNFFQTGIVDALKSNYRIVVFTTPMLQEKLVANGYRDGVDFMVLKDSGEPLAWRLFRQIKKKIYMESRKSNTELLWEKYVRRPFYQKIGSHVVRFLTKFIDPNDILAAIETVDFALNSNEESEGAFDKIKPDVFFATHASTFFEDSLLHSCVKNDVPVTFMVLSWDHLSSKVILSGKYKAILVWNKITKAEILGTSSSYTDDQISIVGVPQYDCYRRAPDMTYQQWCQKYGLDPDLRTILFSTMPQARHEQQHIILGELLQAITEGELASDRLQVLIKCHPFDNSDRYDPLLGKGYPVGICRSTLPSKADPDEWFPSAEEMFVSRDALYFCDININIFSTVTLEAAYYDKPIIHIAFDPNPVTNRIPCREYYNFEHFKNITNSGASILVISQSELTKAISTYLVDPSCRQHERKSLVDMYFVSDEKPSTQNVIDHFKGL